MKSSIAFLSLILIFLSTVITAQENMNNEKCIPCEKLTDLKLPDVKITGATEVSEGTAYCRVLGTIGTEIKFELLLPLEWNGIYIMGGGGGFVGSVQNAARQGVNQGYATSGTDTGHEGNGLLAGWALDNMERQVNFGHLAIHRTAEVSKAVIGSYYGDYPRYSYFIGCSRGGGQAMMEAQRYPDDFDGIVAGAPAFNWPAIASEFIQNIQAAYPSGLDKPLLSPQHIRLLHEEVLRQCDMKDGVADSILNNPLKCKFNFDLLPRCPDDSHDNNCFTPSQVNALKSIYASVSSGNGFTYPGFPFGGEYNPAGWMPWITGPNQVSRNLGYPSNQAAFGIEMFKYLILQDPDWNYLTYNFTGYEKEMRYAAGYLDATSTDYSGIKEHNGKIIFWHGWNDPALSALATIEHYNLVMARDPDLMNYMRLFVLPGVLHCGGGNGPSGVDWIGLIRDWVENAKAPDRIIVTKMHGGKEVMTRPVFPYPDEALYDGNGDPMNENSFVRSRK